MKYHVSRREFLAGAGGLAVGAAAGGLVVGASEGQAASADAPDLSFVPFEGAHQTGITQHPVPAQGLMASFTVLATDRAHLKEMFLELTEEIRGLMAGVPPEQRDSAYPPTDSGILGPTPAPDDLSIIVSVGAGLFDDRYGLSDQRPRELVQMPFIANDRLDPARSHGDLLLTISSQHTDHVIFALRQLMRRTRREMTLKWVIDGFNRRSDPTDTTTGSPRNLLGFVDGTANLPTEAELMDRHVWTAGGHNGEPRVDHRRVVPGGARHPHDRRVLGPHPARRAGGPHRPPEDQRRPARRRPRDRRPRLRRRSRRARSRRSTPTSAWPTRARRRPTPTSSCGAGSRTRAATTAPGQLDQGLAFVCFQKSIATGFLAVQNRLNGEPLEEYIRPEGGGYFFALPGVTTADGYLAQGLLDA